jgi:hypothetical protein
MLERRSQPFYGLLLLTAAPAGDLPDVGRGLG